MAETTSQRPADGAPAGDNQAATPQTPAPEKTEKRVNLHELPEFRAVQANYDRRLAEANQQAQALAARLEQLETKDMSDEELNQHKAQKVYDYARSLEQQLAATRANQDRLTDFQRLSDRMLKRFDIPVPFSVMANATDPANAAELATDYVADELEKRRKSDQRADRKEANRVDTGGGGAVTSSDRKDEEYSKAKSSGELAQIALRRRWDARNSRG